MDLPTPKYFNAPPFFASKSNGEAALEANNSNFYGKISKENPFADPKTSSIEDPLCKLNLKETSEFVKSFPVASNGNNAECRGLLQVSAQRRREQRRVEAPSTPGRPVFSFSSKILAKKSFPSKWDEAEKWLISSSTSCRESPAHSIKPSGLQQDSSKIDKVQCDEMRKQIEAFAEKSRVLVSSFHGSASLDQYAANNSYGVAASYLLLKDEDKLADEVEQVLPNSGYSEPSKEGFLFRNSVSESMKDAGTEVIREVKHKDIGTEMTPIGSCTTSRCHTPYKSTSPARHTTPVTRSGPLALANPNTCNKSVDISHLPDSHFVKLQLGSQYDLVTSNWSSREEEEEEISKSLRHFETGPACRRSVSDSKASVWEEEERTKCCLRYQREEAKIQAWVNLQSAKAEAQSKKLEVKIERMRSKVEEKLMKRMGEVQRKAEEWRAEARQRHLHTIQNNPPHFPSHFSSTCACFPCKTFH